MPAGTEPPVRGVSGPRTRSRPGACRSRPRQQLHRRGPLRGPADAGLEVERTVDEVDLDVVASVELTLQDVLGQMVLDLVLHRATQGPSTEGRVEPTLMSCSLAAA